MLTLNNEVNNSVMDLKNLGVELVKANQELNLVSKKREYDERVKMELGESKIVLNALKGRLSGLDSMKDKAEEAKKQQAAAVEQMKLILKSLRSRSLIEKLNPCMLSYKSYSAPGVGLACEQRLKRHRDVPALPSEFAYEKRTYDDLIVCHSK